MPSYKAFRYRIYPTEAQKARLCRWEHALRFLWNLANEQRRMGHARAKDERIFPTAFDQINELTALRAELPWLADVPRNVCAQLLVELDKAWQQCFRKVNGVPRWKRKGDRMSLMETHTQVWRMHDGLIRFPKLGNLRAIIHRDLEGKPKTCMLHRDGDQWFAGIVCELELEEPALRTLPVVALDRGITNLVADSDGKLTPNPKHLELALQRLARAQRIVARRKKGSRNREKAQRRVMRLHRKVRRQREAVLHQLSHDYAKSHGMVVIEDLNVAGLIRGRLARHLAGAGWSKFAGMLEYKLLWSGGLLVEVPAQYSSQTCAECGHIDAASRRGECFRCVSCGHLDHADVNAAKVLLQRYEARANRSCLPVDGSLPKGPGRSRKVGNKLRVPRRRCPTAMA